ncbi:copper amine oxidase N-terminal domain-containing protein [Cohnella sp. GCM10020058]|uniref:copper amine oxidase N-terminal domain-containing protein n=1 Tax=Cohnella sp. GCM10020058 TaxID=3317330 RepID=UPI0036410FD8
MNGLRVKITGLLLSLLLLVPAFASAHTVSTKGPTPDLRSALGQLLGEHALLAIVAMQKGYDGAPDFAQAAGALNQNTDDLSAAVASVYGADAGAAFKKVWSSHIGYFVDYVKATSAKDEAGRAKAVADLESYRMAQAKFFADANPKYFDEKAIADGLKMHIDHLLTAFNDYVGKNYAAAYDDAKTAYAHMYMTGDALAAGIAAQFPAKFTDAVASNPASDLRSALEQKLGEHALLAILAMQKGIDGAPDFAAAAASLSRNTDELSAAVASVYGVDAGAAFKKIWSSHIGYFVDYVKATGAKDEAGKKTAVAELETYRTAQAKFFAEANPANFSQQAIADGLKMHIDHLLNAFDAYVAKDYSAVYADARTAYAHMFPTGALLAAGIAAQFPEKFHTAAPAPAVMKVWFKVGSSQLIIDGKETTMNTKPYMDNGSNYIPLRYLAEGIGAKVTWDRAAQSVWIDAGDAKAQFWVGKKYMEMNGKRMEIGYPVMLKDDRVQVPVRFIAELFGWDVAWNAKDWSITLTKAMETAASADMAGMHH